MDDLFNYDEESIPNKAEALTLFDKTGVKALVDKNGTSYPIDSIFAPGGASNTWITECSDEKIIRMDLKIGVATDYPTADVWSSMRLIRKEGEAAPVKEGATPTPEVEAASDQPVEPSSADAAKAATTAPAPKASGGTPKPTPRKDFTSEEKAAMRKRAKAHAAEVKARKG